MNELSEQTKQLLLFGNEEKEDVPAALPAGQVDAIKSRMRLLTELKRHPGYEVFMSALKQEAAACLHMMDKADNAHQSTKYSANYYTLTMVSGYVDNELSRLRALLGNTI